MGCSGKVYCWHSINAAWCSVCLGHCNPQGLTVAHLTDGELRSRGGAVAPEGTLSHQSLKPAWGAFVLLP